MQYKELIKQINAENIPQHVGIIMDGNGRWAKKQGFLRLDGHKKGVESVRKAVETAVELNVKHLTIYAFSTENWRRPASEVSGLLKLLKKTLKKEINQLNENNVIVRFIGSNERLPKGFLEELQENCVKTRNNTGVNLNIAFNYGGKQEIIDSVNQIIIDVKNGVLDKDQITEDDITSRFYYPEMPPADLIIRTSGEIRLSNFLLWQSAYSEFWFTDTLWPDFTKEDFLKAVIDYQNRKRRYGDVK